MSWYKSSQAETKKPTSYLDIGHETGKTVVLWGHDGAQLHQRTVRNDMDEWGHLASTDHSAVFPPEILQRCFMSGRIDAERGVGSYQIDAFADRSKQGERLMQKAFKDLTAAFPNITFFTYRGGVMFKGLAASNWYARYKMSFAHAMIDNEIDVLTRRVQRLAKNMDLPPDYVHSLLTDGVRQIRAGHFAENVFQNILHIVQNRKNVIDEAQSTQVAGVKTAEVPEEELGMKRDFAGLEVNVENPAGTERVGVNNKGKEWRTKMKYDYGFIWSVKGTDGDALDVYLGPDQEAANVYIVHQVDPETGDPDEDKCMLGFDNPARAKEEYLAHYDSPKFFGSMSVISFDEFKKIVEEGDRQKVNWKKRAKKVRS